MKVAYVFATDMAAAFKLNTMILPQLEAGNHGVEVVGMMFFDDNIYPGFSIRPARACDRVTASASDVGPLCGCMAYAGRARP